VGGQVPECPRVRWPGRGACGGGRESCGTKEVDSRPPRWNCRQQRRKAEQRGGQQATAHGGERRDDWRGCSVWRSRPCPRVRAGSATFLTTLGPARQQPTQYWSFSPLTAPASSLSLSVRWPAKIAAMARAQCREAGSIVVVLYSPVCNKAYPPTESTTKPDSPGIINSEKHDDALARRLSKSLKVGRTNRLSSAPITLHRP
jgi:hypothetical protein